MFHPFSLPASTPGESWQWEHHNIIESTIKKWGGTEKPCRRPDSRDNLFISHALISKHESQRQVRYLRQAQLNEKKQNLSWVLSTPNRLSELGLTDIKHVELYDKWRPLIPQNQWKDFRYLKEAPTQSKRKNVNKEETQSKKARQNRERTENTITAQQPQQHTQPKATVTFPGH